MAEILSGFQMELPTRFWPSAISNPPISARRGRSAAENRAKFVTKVIFAPRMAYVRLQRSSLPHGWLMSGYKGHLCLTDGLCKVTKVIFVPRMAFVTVGAWLGAGGFAF